MPTGDGNATPRSKTTPLPRSSAQALDTTDAATAGALETVATSSDFGAPDNKLGAKKARRADSPKLPEASFAGSLREIGGSLFGGEGRLTELLVGLAVISLAAAAFARRKSRSAG